MKTMSMKGKLILYSITLVICTVALSAFAAAVLIQRQTRRENRERLTHGMAAIERELLSHIPALEETFQVFGTPQNHSAIYKQLRDGNFSKLITTFKAFKIVRTLYFDFAKNSGVTNFAFYFSSDQAHQPELALQYSRAHSGLIIGKELLRQNEVGYPEVSPVENVLLFPEFHTFTQPYAFQEFHGDVSLMLNFPVVFSENEETAYFVLQKALGIDLDLFDADLGVNINLYDLEGQVLSGRKQFPALALSDDIDFSEVAAFVDAEGKRYDAILRPLTYHDVQIGYVSVSIPQAATMSKIRQTIIVLCLVGGGIVILSAVAAWIFIATFTRHIVALTNVASEMAHGNLELQIPVKSHDEIGVLAQSFARMRDSIRENMDAQQELNQRLDQRIDERTGEVEALQNLMTQVMQIAESLGTTSEGLIQISTQMAAGAEQTSQQAHVVSSSSQQIYEGVHNVSTASEEVAANIREISGNIEKVTNIMTNAVNIANSANSAMAALETHSQEIGQIIKVISDITQQTNLLALNATIEAARAGDSGRGFAVVAGEVKELAHETAVSAEDITLKIEAIQTSSQETANAMTEVAETTNQVSDLSAVIAAAITQQTQVTGEISRTMADTAHGSEEINRAIEEVATTAQHSSQRAAQVQQEAQELSALAEQLCQLVETFTA